MLKPNRNDTVPTDLEPQTTFRGHTAPVTSLAVATLRSLIFSASIDSTIRVWRIPAAPPAHTTYSPYDPTLAVDTLVGHAEGGVWSIAVVPSPDNEEGYLVSGGQDGTVKIWSLTEDEGKGFPLIGSWSQVGSAGEEESTETEESGWVPVSVANYHAGLGQVLVGYSNGTIKTFDVKTGVVAKVFDEVNSGSSNIRTIL